MKLFGWTLYFAFLAGVVVFGWEQPLKVRFGLKPASMPRVAAPSAISPQANATQPSWINDSRRWDSTKGSAAPPPAPAPTTAPQSSL